DKFLASGRIMVKIQDGCDRFCSYCIVPYLRGKPKSIRIADIIETINTYPSSEVRYRTVSDEARSMKTMHSSHPSGSNNKLNEVILTAINTECFGKDTGETLIQLIDAVLKETLIPKISFGSIHPWSITNEFLAYYQSIIPTNRFIPFFHIPIQSGSNKILQLMNRGYAVEDIYRKLKEIKRINPKAFIGTDIIVGFPGETEKEFQETYEFLKSAPIDKIHVFRFSPRPGTAAEKFGKIYGEPTAEEKRKRSKMILNINTNK
ncbi:MAG: radical SAM protein, partial [Candidatus Micrarchaeia archaeon]